MTYQLMIFFLRLQALTWIQDDYCALPWVQTLSQKILCFLVLVKFPVSLDSIVACFLGSKVNLNSRRLLCSTMILSIEPKKFVELQFNFLSVWRRCHFFIAWGKEQLQFKRCFFECNVSINRPKLRTLNCDKVSEASSQFKVRSLGSVALICYVKLMF